MRIVNFKKNGVATLGVRRDGEVIDLSVADKSLPRDLAGLLGAGKGALAKAARAARDAPKRAVVKAPRTVLPPIENPGKIICVGLNYSAHAAEAGLKPPDYPILFLRVDYSPNQNNFFNFSY